MKPPDPITSLSINMSITYDTTAVLINKAALSLNAN